MGTVKVMGDFAVRETAMRWLLLEPLQRDRPYLWGKLDSRGLRVALLLFVVLVLNGFDLAYTLTAHQMGLLNEMNPIADGFFKAGLEPSLICFKILMVLCGTWMLWKLRRSTWVVPACWVLVVAYVGLGVIWYEWVQNVSVGLDVANAGWLRGGP